NWTVTVAPRNWDGFAPLPAKGQSADASGQLITAQLSGGTYAAPRQVVANYQNLVSVHGQVSLDLTGSQARQLGGAGLASEVVYAVRNESGGWDAAAEGPRSPEASAPPPPSPAVTAGPIAGANALPGAPTGLKAVPNNAQVTLSWTAVPGA